MPSWCTFSLSIPFWEKDIRRRYRAIDVTALYSASTIAVRLRSADVNVSPSFLWSAEEEEGKGSILQVNVSNQIQRKGE